MSNKIYFKIILTGKLENNDGAICEIDLCAETPLESALATFRNTFYFSVDALLTQFAEKLTTKYKELEERKQKEFEVILQKAAEHAKQNEQTKVDPPKAGPPAVTPNINNSDDKPKGS